MSTSHRTPALLGLLLPSTCPPITLHLSLCPGHGDCPVSPDPLHLSLVFCVPAPPTRPVPTLGHLSPLLPGFRCPRPRFCVFCCSWLLSAHKHRPNPTSVPDSLLPSPSGLTKAIQRATPVPQSFRTQLPEPSAALGADDQLVAPPPPGCDTTTRFPFSPTGPLWAPHPGPHSIEMVPQALPLAFVSVIYSSWVTSLTTVCPHLERHLRSHTPSDGHCLLPKPCSSSSFPQRAHIYQLSTYDMSGPVPGWPAGLMIITEDSSLLNKTHLPLGKSDNKPAKNQRTKPSRRCYEENLQAVREGLPGQVHGDRALRSAL